MKTQWIPDATLCGNVCHKPGISLTFKALSSRVQNALEALREGCDEESLSEFVEEDELTSLYYHLEELRKHGFIQYSTLFLSMVPFNAEFTPRNFEDTPYRLSRFTLCREQGGKFVVETPLTPVRGYLSEEGVRLLHALTQRSSLEKLSSLFPHVSIHEMKDTLALLAAAGMITSEEETSPIAQWEFHDLLFHTRSRMGRMDSPYGGTFRFKGVFPTESAVKQCKRAPLIPLKRPDQELTLSLEQTLAKRKSIREQGETPIHGGQLGEFLWRCARIKECRMAGEEEFTSRPYPGGGARYELEIYPVIYRCEGLEAGVYHYHPLEHQLCRITDLNAEAKKILEDACRSSGKQEYPQVLLMISARFQRVSWKYQSMAYAVILKDLGILIQTMYLVATASDLAPCALGGGDSDLFCKVAETNYLEETSVGEFMLGSLPE